MNNLQFYLVLASMIVLLALQLAGTIWVAKLVWKDAKQLWKDLPKFWIKTHKN